MEFWKGSVAFNEHLMHAMHGIPTWAKLSATAAMLTGLAIAIWAYLLDTTVPARFTATFRVLYDFLLNKWYFDELYDFLFVRPGLLARPLPVEERRRGHDRSLRPRRHRRGGRGNRRSMRAKAQSGYLYTYALVMLLGLAAAATWAMVG